MRTRYLVATASAVAFLAGALGTVTLTRAAQGFNFGLANALGSVGQNLLGAGDLGVERFAARGQEVTLANGVDTEMALVIDIANTSPIPVYVNVFHPPDPTHPPDPNHPCATEHQIRIGGSGNGGAIQVFFDSDVAIERGFGDPDPLLDEIHPPDPCLEAF
ncbi:MAG: hypothetical protein OEU25_10640, partial [Rhodospirillales bacterium]|nr:hypothetical protein [Rhodospirillales bacterium]